MLFRHLLLLAGAALVSGQTSTDCNPLNDTCPPDAALSTSHNFVFNQSVNGDLWENFGGPVNFDATTGGQFSVAKQGDSPTLRTNFYFFFGRTEVWLKAASGTGIVSSIMWLSDDLDEVDWEILGHNNTFASSNYFGKGVEDFHNAKIFEMASTPDDFHNYTTYWTKDKLEWWIDGNLLRTLTPDQANNSQAYPQTPMRMSLGIWAAGDPSLPEGTRDWAGGTTDYSKGPYDMFVKSAMVSDFSTGKEYQYSDNTGSYQSIKIIDPDKNSTALDAINKSPDAADKSISEKWAELSSGAKIGVYCGAAAFVGLFAIGLAVYFFKQRRRGAQEAKLAADRAEAEKLEMDRYRKGGVDPDGLTETGTEYDARSIKTAPGVNAVEVAGPLDNTSWAAMPLLDRAAGPPHSNGRASSHYSSASTMGPRSPPLPMSPTYNHYGNPPATYDQQQSSRSVSSPTTPGFAPVPGHASGFGQRSPSSPVNTNFSRGGPRAPQGYDGPRTASPAPSQRSTFQQPYHNGYGVPPPGRMQSPGPGRMGSPGPGRMGSPGPGRMGSPGPGQMQSPGPGYNRGGYPGDGHAM